MSFSSYPPLGPDSNSLPLKKRDQRPDSPSHNPQCDGAIFKAPYPYKRHSSPLKPVPRRVQPLRHSWTDRSSRIKPHVLSAFTDYKHWTEFNNVPSPQPWSPFNQQLYPHLSEPANYEQPTSVSLQSLHVQNASHWERKLQNANKEMHGRNKGLYMHIKNIKSTLENTSLTSLSSSTLKSRENLKVKSVPPQTSSQSPALTPLPWLLPHFEAGSLIELQDGRLRRVENLQTEDFLLGALACPDLRLSCCTVQRICTSEPPPYMCRLLLLLHEPHSQELVDVYMEYPFFVWDRGWSSCCPQRTARLCGLQCRQLSVGDVCLALTPVSAPCLLDSASLEPEIPTGGTDWCEKPLLPPCLQTSPTGKSRRPEEGRKRHSSAPN